MPVLYAKKPFKRYGNPVAVGQRLTVSSILARRIVSAGLAGKTPPAPVKQEKPKAKAKGGKNEAAE